MAHLEGPQNVRSFSLLQQPLPLEQHLNLMNKHEFNYRLFRAEAPGEGIHSISEDAKLSQVFQNMKMSQCLAIRVPGPNHHSVHNLFCVVFSTEKVVMKPNPLHSHFAN